MGPVDEFEKARFSSLIWLLPVAFALHEAEEWYILDWYRVYWTNLGDLTTVIVRTGLVFASVVGFLLTGLALFLPPRWSAHLLVLVFAFPFLHTFLHIYWLFYFGAFSPGVLTAVLLVIPAFVLVAGRALRQRLVRPWFVAPACLVNFPQIIGAVRLGNRLPEGGLPWYRLAERIGSSLPWLN